MIDQIVTTLRRLWAPKTAEAASKIIRSRALHVRSGSVTWAPLPYYWTVHVQQDGAGVIGRKGGDE